MADAAIQLSVFPKGCSVQLDKEVSCDGGTTWHDVTGSDDTDGSGTYGCTTLNTSNILVRYKATNPATTGGLPSSNLDSCVFTESNGQLVSTPPISIPAGSTITWDADPKACSLARSGGEPDLARIECACADSNQTTKPKVNAQDTATFDCCGAQIDKQVDCNGDGSFQDRGYGDGTTGSCIGGVGNSIGIQYRIKNTGTVPVTCSITDNDRDGTIIAPPGTGYVVNAGLESGFIPGPATICSRSRALREPDTANLSCTCGAGAPADLRATDSDTASFACCGGEIDKEVSCNAGTSWVDTSLITPQDDGSPVNGATMSCEAPYNSNVLLRHIINNTGNVPLTCDLTDKNQSGTGTDVCPPVTGAPVAGTGSNQYDANCSVACNNTTSGEEPNKLTVPCTCDGAIPGQDYTGFTKADLAAFTCACPPKGTLILTKDCDRTRLPKKFGDPIYFKGTVTNSYPADPTACVAINLGTLKEKRAGLPDVTLTCYAADGTTVVTQLACGETCYYSGSYDPRDCNDDTDTVTLTGSTYTCWDEPVPDPTPVTARCPIPVNPHIDVTKNCELVNNDTQEHIWGTVTNPHNTSPEANYGDIALKNLVVTDSVYSPVTPIPCYKGGVVVTTLAPGESCTYDQTYDLLTPCGCGVDITDRVTATAEPICVHIDPPSADSVTDYADCTVSCPCPGACRLTAGGFVCADSNNDGVITRAECETNYDPTISINPSSIDKATFGGQVGAPYVIAGCHDIYGCIQGQWTHQRHKGKFSAGGGAPADSPYLSMKCRCTDVDGNTIPTVGGLCNPRECGGAACFPEAGPEPRPAPANVACFTGVGDWKANNGAGSRTRPVAFRVDIEDRGEPGGGQNAGQLTDVYQFRMWIPETCSNDSTKTCNNDSQCVISGVAGKCRIDASCTQSDATVRQTCIAQKLAEMGSVCCDTEHVDGVYTTTTLPGIPNVHDGGNLIRGNLQIHPQTGNRNNNASCPPFPMP